MAAASEGTKVTHARFVWLHAYSRKTTVVLYLAEYDNGCTEPLVTVLNQSGVDCHCRNEPENQTRRVESSVVKMLFRGDIFHVLN